MSQIAKFRLDRTFSILVQAVSQADFPGGFRTTARCSWHPLRWPSSETHHKSCRPRRLHDRQGRSDRTSTFSTGWCTVVWRPSLQWRQALYRRFHKPLFLKPVTYPIKRFDHIKGVVSEPKFLTQPLDMAVDCPVINIRGPRKIITARELLGICSRMIPVCSPSDSVLFTPKMPATASPCNISRSPQLCP